MSLRLIALLLLVPLAACQTTREPYMLGEPAQFRPNDRIVIYSHGTPNPRKGTGCRFWNGPPETLKVAAREADYHVVRLCSRAIDDSRGEYIYTRADEITAKVEEYVGRGVPRRNIVLAGHSAGAWASLMAISRSPRLVDALIAFAPACCGTKESRQEKYPEWEEVRRRQIAELSSGETLRAVVFAYVDDKWETPDDLSFLQDKFPRSVQLRSVSCRKGHQTYKRDCQAEETTAAIRSYLD